MAYANETENAVQVPLNALSQIQERMAAGRVPWIGPLLLVSARTVLLLASQGLMALILLGLHRPAPWRAAGDWWTVYGTLVDIGCLIGLWYFTRKEGIRLRDLIGSIHWRRGRDLWTGLGLFLLIFPLFIVGGMLSNLLVFGSMSAGPNPTGAVHGAFPFWGMVYSLCVWWIIWTPTEQMTYQGYALPRLRARSGSTWVALAVVGFWWSLQHSFLPFVPEWRIVVWRFVMVVPGIIVYMLVYLRTRRLAPLIVSQWPMDIVVAVMTTVH